MLLYYPRRRKIELNNYCPQISKLIRASEIWAKTQIYPKIYKMLLGNLAQKCFEEAFYAAQNYIIQMCTNQ